jgi:hypothetical protein
LPRCLEDGDGLSQKKLKNDPLNSSLLRKERDTRDAIPASKKRSGTLINRGEGRPGVRRKVLVLSELLTPMRYERSGQRLGIEVHGRPENIFRLKDSLDKNPQAGDASGFQSYLQSRG